MWKKNLSDKVESVNKWLKNDIAANEIQRKMSGLSKEVSDLYLQLGKQCYQIIKEQPLLGTEDLCRKISEKHEEYKTYEEQLKLQEETGNDIICTKCKNRIPVGSNFCPICGEKRPIPLKCPACGKSVKAEDKFCVWCGKPLE